MNCPICDKEVPRSIGLHLYLAHRAQPLAPNVPSFEAIQHALDTADPEAVTAATDFALAGRQVKGLHHSDRIAAVVACIQRGNTSAAPKRLGVNGSTIVALRRLVASGAI